MRATQHSGRTAKNGVAYSTKHNDRSFEAEADNIDRSRTPFNSLWHCYQGTPGIETFEDAEAEFYRQRFGKTLQKTNERYIKNGHAERCKTMNEWRASRQHCPEELILQIGNMDSHVPDDVFKACVNDYISALNEYAGEHMQVLDIAIHVDETVPHAHIRRVWMCQDKDGAWTTGQEKALEALGVSLPNPADCPSKSNNRKKTFDARMRDKWLDICEAHGIEIEREPVPDARHNRTKAKLIRDNIQDSIKQLETARQDIFDAETRKNALEAEISDIESTMEAELDAYKDKLAKKQEEYSELVGDTEQARAIAIRPPEKTLLGKESEYIKLPYAEYEQLARRATAVDSIVTSVKTLKSAQKDLEAGRSTLEAEKRQIRAKSEELDNKIMDISEREKQADSVMFENETLIIDLENAKAKADKLAKENQSLRDKLREHPFMEWLSSKLEPMRDTLKKLFYAEKIIENPACEEAVKERKLAHLQYSSLSLDEKLSGRAYENPYTEQTASGSWRYCWADESGKEKNGNRASFVAGYYEPLAEKAGMFADADLIEQARTHQQELNLNRSHGRSR